MGKKCKVVLRNIAINFNCDIFLLLVVIICKRKISNKKLILITIICFIVIVPLGFLLDKYYFNLENDVSLNIPITDKYAIALEPAEYANPAFQF